MGLVLGFLCAFQPPGPEERLKAIGPTGSLPESLRRALDPARGFEPMNAPGPSDWLASHDEEGQTYQDFSNSGPLRPEGRRKKIFLVALGEFTPEKCPEVDSLKAYASIFFGLPVEVLPPLSVGGQRLTTRRNPNSGNLQVLTGDVLSILKERLPPDGACLVAITMTDLYPDPTWNFVFGQALLRGRVGVFSFARYDPAFYGEKRGRGYRALLLKRSIRVLVHETAHVFGLKHCVFFRCVMNGSNNLEESDSRPLHLCPVCLRKLQSTLGFEVVDRYRKLEEFYRKVRFEEEAQWVKERLKAISRE
jgi:archaemetzincin